MLSIAATNVLTLKQQRPSQTEVWLGNKYRFLDINRFSFLQTDIDS